MLEKYQFITLLGSLIAGFAFLWKVARGMKKELKEDMNVMKKELKAEMSGMQKELKEDLKDTTRELASQGKQIARMEGILSWLEKYFLGADEN